MNIITYITIRNHVRLNPKEHNYDEETADAELVLNLTHQAPHFFLLTNEGINWLKGTEGIKYKNDSN